MGTLRGKHEGKCVHSGRLNKLAGFCSSRSHPIPLALTQSAVPGSLTLSCPQVQGLILALMYEKVQSKKSKWHAYLEFMPSSTDLPMFWEVRKLPGSFPFLWKVTLHSPACDEGGRYTFDPAICKLALGMEEVRGKSCSHSTPGCTQASELEELRGTAALDKMEGEVQQPADAPTRVGSVDEWRVKCE